MDNILKGVLLLSIFVLGLTACGGSSSDTPNLQNSVPVANAGFDQEVATNAMVTLNGGSSTDADGDTLSYSWSLISLPAGSAASLSNSAVVSPTFTADIDGSYKAQLIVHDGIVSSVADTVSIIASRGNLLSVIDLAQSSNGVISEHGDFYYISEVTSQGELSKIYHNDKVVLEEANSNSYFSYLAVTASGNCFAALKVKDRKSSYSDLSVVTVCGNEQYEVDLENSVNSSGLKVLWSQNEEIYYASAQRIFAINQSSVETISMIPGSMLMNDAYINDEFIYREVGSVSTRYVEKVDRLSGDVEVLDQSLPLYSPTIRNMLPIKDKLLALVNRVTWSYQKTGDNGMWFERADLGYVSEFKEEYLSSRRDYDDASLCSFYRVDPDIITEISDPLFSFRSSEANSTLCAFKVIGESEKYLFIVDTNYRSFHDMSGFQALEKVDSSLIFPVTIED